LQEIEQYFVESGGALETGEVARALDLGIARGWNAPLLTRPCGSSPAHDAGGLRRAEVGAIFIEQSRITTKTGGTGMAKVDDPGRGFGTDQPGGAD
jgi:hypothetical protein